MRASWGQLQPLVKYIGKSRRNILGRLQLAVLQASKGQKKLPMRNTSEYIRIEERAQTGGKEAGKEHVYTSKQTIWYDICIV